MHDFSQLPYEFCQSLHVLVPSFQQLKAKTGDVLFDLFQFTCETVSEPQSNEFFIIQWVQHMKSTVSRGPAELAFIHLIIVFISLCFQDVPFDEAIHYHL